MGSLPKYCKYANMCVCVGVGGVSNTLTNERVTTNRFNHRFEVFNPFHSDRFSHTYCYNKHGFVHFVI